MKNNSKIKNTKNLELLEVRQLLAADQVEADVAQQADAVELSDTDTSWLEIAYHLSGLKLVEDLATQYASYPISSAIISYTLFKGATQGGKMIPLLSSLPQLLPSGFLQDAASAVLNNNLLVSSFYSGLHQTNDVHHMDLAEVQAQEANAINNIKTFETWAEKGLAAAKKIGVSESVIRSSAIDAGLGKTTIDAFAKTGNSNGLAGTYIAKVDAQVQQGLTHEKAWESLEKHIESQFNKLGKQQQNFVSSAKGVAQEQVNNRIEAQATLKNLNNLKNTQDNSSSYVSSAMSGLSKIGAGITNTAVYLNLAHHEWKLLTLAEDLAWKGLQTVFPDSFIDDEVAQYIKADDAVVEALEQTRKDLNKCAQIIPSFQDRMLNGGVTAILESDIKSHLNTVDHCIGLSEKFIDLIEQKRSLMIQGIELSKSKTLPGPWANKGGLGLSASMNTVNSQLLQTTQNLEFFKAHKSEVIESIIYAS